MLGRAAPRLGLLWLLLFSAVSAGWTLPPVVNTCQLLLQGHGPAQHGIQRAELVCRGPGSIAVSVNSTYLKQHVSSFKGVVVNNKVRFEWRSVMAAASPSEHVSTYCSLIT
jgi:hypothetical protein